MKNKTLLFIQDKKIASALSKGLEKMGLDVSIASKAANLKKIFDEVPHLIVIEEDYNRGEGGRLAAEIKQDAVLKYIPIILLVRDDYHLNLKKYEKMEKLLAIDTGVDPVLSAVQDQLKRNHNELDLNPLTYFPGTRSSVLRIERAISSKEVFAVLCLDLSDLGAFNSAYGDVRGDEVIVRLSEIIKKAIRSHGSSDDFFGHLGGDDFVVVTSSEKAISLSEQIIQLFDGEVASFYDPYDRELGYIVQRNQTGDLTQYPIMSVSIAIVSNEESPLNTMTQISGIAGALEKHMRTLPGSCYVKFRHNDQSIQIPSDEDAFEVHFPSKMKSVLVSGFSANTDKFSVFINLILKDKKIQTLYQPLVQLKTRAILGYEALTRATVQYPSSESTTLFNLAREASRIKELDEICVEFALKNAQTLSVTNKLFLNLNHETLIDQKLMRSLFSNKGSLGFKNLVIEVTEQSILRSFDKVREALFELKQQGVSVAIDDVGGGAVSLRDVAILKPDYIKFDRSLIRQIDISTTKQQIVLSLILFAHGISATTVAEGIETREEYEAVMMCGVDIGQGYYLARPGAAFPKLQFDPQE